MTTIRKKPKVGIFDDVEPDNSHLQIQYTHTPANKPFSNLAPSAADTVGSTFVYTPLNNPLALETTPLAINDTGQVAGWYFDKVSGQSYGFLYDTGTYRTISYPSAYATLAFAISAKGQVVGFLRCRQRRRRISP